MNVARSINVALAKRDMSRTDLANLMGVTPQNIHNMINRDKTNTATLKKVADAFGMPVSEFIKLGEEE